MPRGDDMFRDYHIVLSNGQERNIKSVAMIVNKNGSLEFENAVGEVTLAIADGAWQYVELETRDDRG